MSGQTLTGQTLGGYRVGRLVGKGGSGTVYRVRRLASESGGTSEPTVALKVFHADLIADERTFKRFEREAELGLKIRHPHVVPTLDCGSATHEGATLHYMVMEFVQGESLRDMLAELGVVPEDLLYQIADQSLDALGAIHREGMVHRDVKPENIVITPDHRCLLMDLGVARLQQEGRDLTLAGEFIGSLAYAAPEQFTDQDHVDPRADLYALGVMLYEMATGVNPFDEPSLLQLIEKKLHTPVRRPKLLNRDVEPFLDEVIQTCLEVAPEDRFAGCDELRAILQEREESAWWKSRIEGQAFPASARALRRVRVPRDAPLVGRDAEVEALHAAFDAARSGRGALALVSGPAGIGKSRLVHDFFEDLMTPDGPVLLAGHCPEEGGRAHHPFLDAIRGYLGEREGAAEQLAAHLPAEDAARVSSLAGMVFGEATDLAEDELDVLATAFVGALAAKRPVVLALEDLQWADPATLTQLEHLARHLTAAPVLIVVTWRPDAVEAGAPMHALTTTLAAESGTHAIALAPLSREDVDAVLAALVQVPRTVRALGWSLAEASAGNPHFLLEIVEHLRQSGSLAEGEGGWIPTGPIGDVLLPDSLRLLLLLRLVDVEPELMQLLEAASAQGPAFDASVLATVTGQKRLRLLKRLAVLERKHGLIDSLGRNAFRFASHSLWQVIYSGMREERRRECHALCADALRASDAPIDGERAYTWVRHQLAAGHIEDALDAVLPAIEHAATQVHAVRGLAFLGDLSAALDASQPALRFELTMRLATLHRLRGNAAEAREALEQAVREADAVDAPAPRCRVATELAFASLRAGDLEPARAESDRALAFAAESGHDALRAGALQAAGRLAYRAAEFERSAACWREALAIHRAAGDRHGEATALLELGRVMPEIGERDEVLSTREAACEAFRESGDRRGEAAALDAVGNAWVDAGQGQKAMACYEQSLALVRELGDLPAEAATLHNTARLFAMESRIEEARETFERALDIFRQLGDGAGEASALDELGTALSAFGDHDTAVEYLVKARATAERIEHGVILARVLRHLAGVRHETGEHARAWEDFDRALALGPRSARSTTLAEMGRAALAENDVERAASLLQDALACAEGGAQRLIGLSRLARAHVAAGRAGEARACTDQVEAMLADEAAPVPQHLGPEVFYSLAEVLDGEERAADYLVKANALLDERTRAIRTVVYREHYLTTRWPNREILMRVRELDS